MAERPKFAGLFFTTTNGLFDARPVQRAFIAVFNRRLRKVLVADPILLALLVHSDVADSIVGGVTAGVRSLEDLNDDHVPRFRAGQIAHRITRSLDVALHGRFGHSPYARPDPIAS